MKKFKKGFLITLGVIAAVLVINFAPTLSLKTGSMNELHGTWVSVYYENETSAAQDVFTYADEETAYIAEKLGFSDGEDVNVYVYDFQSTMQTKKYGYIAPLLGLDWYIGDNIGTDVILTSPANPGKVHDYENVKCAVLHEIVHAYVNVMNKDVDMWLTEGCALFLSNGEPFYKEYIQYTNIPTYRDTCSNNPLTFSKCGGYEYAHTYIEYLEKIYGWNSVIELIKTENYEECFGKSRKAIYDEWVGYITDYYQ